MPNGASKKLSAVTLKDALWDTLQRIQSGNLQPAEGDAIAGQAREILRTVKVQLQVVGQAKRSVPLEIIKFAEEA